MPAKIGPCKQLKFAPFAKRETFWQSVSTSVTRQPCSLTKRSPWKIAWHSAVKGESTPSMSKALIPTRFPQWSRTITPSAARPEAFSHAASTLSSKPPFAATLQERCRTWNHLFMEMAARRVDLRSDTVTKPTPTMRAAMAAAEVDDDVLGSDPSAARLEVEMAGLTGKEAALFVPSGTMGNLISVLVHCDVRGSEVVLGNNSHIHIYENGGISTIGGVHPRPVANNPDGTMDIGAIIAAIRDPRGELVYPTTRLICLENSHGNAGGRVLSVEYTDKVGEVAKEHGLKLHIDGARIFNAAVALGVPVHRLVQAADSVSVCLSKGLGAPVGTVIVGSHSFIKKARRLRKTLGGGMRQVGVLCAAAFVAVHENVGKLEADHRNAKFLAVELNKIKGLSVNVASVETNIMFIDIDEGSKMTSEKICQNLEKHGVILMKESSSRIRIVLHHQISSDDVKFTLSCFQQALKEVHVENGN